MCGIYGILSKRDDLSSLKIKKFNASFKQNMGYRGPDESGSYFSKNKRVFLGHLRLSIVDLKSGQQPMLCNNNDNVVIFNGEIFNHKDLRNSSGYDFKTSSDTEVILSEYLKRGTTCFDYFNGMYSIAIYDEKNDVLSIAVDPVGVKSVYYFENEDYFIFSSELVPLCLSLRNVFGYKLEKDLNSTYKFFYHGMYINNETPVKNISKVIPGEITTYQKKCCKKVTKISFQSSCSKEKELGSIVDRSIERQLMADVPISIFLSGGIDSSIVASYAALHKKDLKCYTFSFEKDSKDDESNFALEVANQLRVEIELVSIDDAEVFDSFLQAIDFMDEPLSDFAVVPLLTLSKAASHGAKVCILGDGGDELFYGYTHHKFWKYKMLLNNKLFRVIKFDRVVSWLSYKLEFSKFKLFRHVGLFFKLMTPFHAGYGPFSNCIHLFKKKISGLKYLENIDELIDWERENSLNRQLLQKTDRITMRKGLEARVPLLDLELVSFTNNNFDIHNCIVGGLGKMPLRKLLERQQSIDITKRKKQGFRTPSDAWLKGKLANYIFEKILNTSVLDIFISKENIRLLISEHSDSKKDHSARILTLYSYLVFCDKVFSQD